MTLLHKIVLSSAACAILCGLMFTLWRASRSSGHAAIPAAEAPTSRLTTTTSTVFYTSVDCPRYQQWPGRKDSDCNSMPRVLLFTCCSEGTFTDFRNEVYWKACYAHTHGYDLIIADQFNSSQVRTTQDAFWAWWMRLIELVPKYDYVFVSAANALISEVWLHFPVWAFNNEGFNDLSVMDQCYSDWGLNMNAFLFKNTDWSIEFLREGLAFKDMFIVQGDNGGWMENILTSLGHEASQRGEKGYKKSCLRHLLLPEPLEKVLKRNDSLYADKNLAYSRCFFSELDRLAGAYNERRLSQHIGFNPLLDVANQVSYSSVPWANCWSHLHDPFYSKLCVGAVDPKVSCFTFHWNGMTKFLEDHTDVKGTCPDPTFRWNLSPYNIAKKKE